MKSRSGLYKKENETDKKDVMLKFKRQSLIKDIQKRGNKVHIYFSFWRISFSRTSNELLISGPHF